jgi:hypothetical protein
MKLLIPESYRAILYSLVDEFRDEFSLFGKTSITEDGNHILEDLCVPKQTNSSCATDVEADDFMDLAQELHEKGEDLANWNLWIHSHNTMRAFWSTTDTDQMEDFCKGRDYMLHLVISSHETQDHQAAITQYKPYRLDNLDIEVEWIQEEVEERDPPATVVAATQERDRLEALIAAQTDIIEAWEDAPLAEIETRVSELVEEIKSKELKPVTNYDNLNRLLSETRDHPFPCKCRKCEELTELCINSRQD